MTLKPKWIYRFLRIVLQVLLRVFLRIRHRGTDTIPRGPKIYVVNHPTVYDLFPILALAEVDFVHVLIEEQIWSFPLLRFLMRLTNQVCLKTGRRFDETLEESLFLLASGRSVVMSPEGGRTHPDEDVRARKSVVRLALEGKVPVLPVGVWLPDRNIVIRKINYNFENRQYVDMAHFPRFRTRYGIVFGKPLNLSGYYRETFDGDMYQKLAEKILSEVYDLSREAKKLLNSSS